MSFTMLIIAATQSAAIAGQTAPAITFVGSFDTLSICETEKKRLEDADKANPPSMDTKGYFVITRQCMRRS